MSQVSVRNTASARDDRRWIESVYRDYLADLAPQATGVFPALGEVGHREPDQLSRWFADRNSQVLTILYGEAPVGFAMVRRRAQGAGERVAGERVSDPAEFFMAEFFISRSWRRRGIGAQAVRLLFDRFAGQWLIIEHERNQGAVTFWRGVVATYTRGNYREQRVNGEVQQRFESGPRRR
ncbi:MAG: GNAT family N-acetyltransferase [Steroidobacteraceae bacterium]|jgi:predicted acetyltransferase